MRISELSARSGVPVATIKYYLREGLLAAGAKSSETQAEYDDGHVARLRVIRAFLEVGGLSVAGARGVLAAIDDENLEIGYGLGIAQSALPVSVPARLISDPVTPGGAMVDAIIAERGWHVAPENPGSGLAARVLDDYLGLGRPDLAATLPVYAEAAELVAGVDLDAVQNAGTRSRMTETVVVGTVLGDALFAGLRRMAHEDAATRRFPVPPVDTRPGKDLAP
jgi:DNA-binding transcriptional MerR regulator